MRLSHVAPLGLRSGGGTRLLYTCRPSGALDQESSAVLNLCNLCNHLNP